MMKQVFNGNPNGRRPLGRPKLRWEDQEQKDVRKMGTETKATEDRAEWRRTVGEAKPHFRFVWPLE